MTQMIRKHPMNQKMPQMIPTNLQTGLPPLSLRLRSQRKVTEQKQPQRKFSLALDVAGPGVAFAPAAVAEKKIFPLT